MADELNVEVSAWPGVPAPAHVAEVTRGGRSKICELSVRVVPVIGLLYMLLSKGLQNCPVKPVGFHMKLSKTERINRFSIQNLNFKFYRPKLVSRLISDSKFKSQNLMNQNHDHIFKYHGHRFLIFLFNFFDFVNHDHISSNSASLGRPPALGTSNMITDNKSSPSDSSVNYRRTPAPPPTR
jgi:hypothetical protein